LEETVTTERSAARSGDNTWSSLATLDPEARTAAIRGRFDEVLALSDEEMDARLEGMIIAEYELDATHLHSFTASRLRGVLAIAEQDIERARRLQRAYDRVFDRLPGALAMRRTELVQTIARTELSAQEVELLRELLPSLLAQLPRASAGALPPVTPRAAAAQGGTRKPWWKVW
jgi:hypothetical protein